jgi:hypothetical protein
MRGAVWLTLSGHRVSAFKQQRPPRGDARLRERIYEDEQGVLTVPLLVLLLASTLLGLGTLGLMRHWRHLTELQLRLDRCVGNAALDLKKTLERIEAGNSRLRALRAAQVAATLVEAAGSLVPLMEAEVAHQQLELLRWQARQAEWLALRGCDGKADLPAPLPSMSWSRPPPDLIGPQLLSWSSGERRLALELYHSPRAAAAVVEAGGSLGSDSWKASWSFPGNVPGAHVPGLLRTSID